MKINQVEELVGITKKNIRFYEDQGLVKPGRDPQNGYREYDLTDVAALRRVKLLRQLGFPCEQIRLMQEGKISFDDGMRQRMSELEQRGRDLEQIKAVCAMMSDEVDDLESLDASEYIEKMQQLEKGGVQLMNVRMSDVNKRKTGAVIAAVVMIALLVTLVIGIIWANTVDPAPAVIIVFCVVLFGAMIVGIAIALRQRLKELASGELDEANKY
ncbi:MAG: MerR family transcriptional regulator [Mogibacterium sp.]|nr:MerR family transcriptional regulator [Mogibacterium sp.]